MKIFLTVLERNDLLVRHKLERDKRVGDRMKVILLADEGWHPELIARALFIDDSTVRRHLNAYRDENRLTPDHKGSEAILTPNESQSLSKHIEETCYVKVKDIQEHVRNTYDKDLATSTLTTWLKRNDFSYKKPKLTPKADYDLQQKFIEEYNKTLNQAALDGDPVLFGDSVHPSQQTRPAYGWIKRGKDKIIEINSARKRLNIMGAISLETMKFQYKMYDKINGIATIEFMKQLEAAYPNNQKIHLILDNAGYHRSAEVEEYLKTSRVRVLFLPPRSPNLNSIERLWKIMHEYVSNNRIHAKFKDFKKAILYFFKSTMPSIFDVLVSRITDDFHVVSSAK